MAIDTDIGIFDNLQFDEFGQGRSAEKPKSSLGPSSGLQSDYSLSINNSWITYQRDNLLWLPQDYLPQSVSAWPACGMTFAISCASDHVLFLDFSTMIYFDKWHILCLYLYSVRSFISMAAVAPQMNMFVKAWSSAWQSPFLAKLSNQGRVAVPLQLLLYV